MWAITHGNLDAARLLLAVRYALSPPTDTPSMVRGQGSLPTST
jgi:hypothetical protein